MPFSLFTRYLGNWHKHWLSLAKLKTMKRIKVIAIAVLSIIGIATHGQVRGNGSLESKAFNFEGIESIVFHITVKAELDLSLNDEFVVYTDGNIFEHLKVKQKGNTLVMDQNKWIEPTTMQVKAGLKGLQKLTSSAWGNISIKNMEQESFSANMGVGRLNMQGTLISLIAKVGAGTIDARDTQMRRVDARIDQNGRILTDNAERIKLSGNGYGQFVYDRADVLNWSDDSSNLTLSTLTEFREREANKGTVTYIDVKLKNNSGKKIDIFFRGPIDAPLGYGIPIRARVSKKERLPLGTRIYQETLIGRGKLLYTITKENKDETILLFHESN